MRALKNKKIRSHVGMSNFKDSARFDMFLASYKPSNFRLLRSFYLIAVLLPKS